MKRMVFLFLLLATGAVLAGACGMQPGGTQQEVGEMQHVSSLRGQPTDAA